MEISRLNPECISCLIKKQIDKYPKNASRRDKIDYMQAVLKIVATATDDMSAPEIVDEIYMLRREMFNEHTDFGKVKKYFNNLMLGMEKTISDEINDAAEPLKRALQMVMMGNYIDFGAMDKVDEDKLNNLILTAKDIEISESEYDKLKKDIIRSKKIAYLTDNCGEIVLDKLLMGEILKINPNAKITAVVRGGEVLNDATLPDAEQVGLLDMADVIDNGTAYAGTCLDKISDEALDAIEGADMVISKGQGNFETLNRCGLNIYYIFMCKCDMFAKRFNVPLLSGMLINDDTVSDMNWE